jgi:metallo-beta-lactamase family protein
MDPSTAPAIRRGSAFTRRVSEPAFTPLATLPDGVHWLMRLTFHGAAGEVTGSCSLLETDHARILIDFGMHQGSAKAEERNRRPPPLDAPNLDAVILTHAHLDHCGRLPLLARAGFRGPIFTTPASMSLTEILLRDSANIQSADNERTNRRRRRMDLGPVPPLYEMEEVEAVLKLFRPLPYWEERTVARGITARLVDAGHILGSASVELAIEEGGRTRTVVFSGDIGPHDTRLMRNPTQLKKADILILESTYGDRNHRSRPETRAEFRTLLTEAAAGSGKVLIPAFAVGRTQNLLYEIGCMHRAGEWAASATQKKGPSEPNKGSQTSSPVPVYLDSPMAIDTTDLYMQFRELLDADTQSLLSSGVHPLRFPGLNFSRQHDESMRLNGLAGAAVIIAGSGMCTGGRIVHHLKHQLWRPEAHVMIVGFQAQGTLGRRLVDGHKRVRILGEPIAVKARIHTIGGLSAHAGQSELVQWAQNFDPPPKQIFLTHGESKARSALSEILERELKTQVIAPALGDAAEF